ncbi:YisL family protein [uncultured Secundilactobacillus sp.]|uniref:YisL family protein n=1 Tax=uncultured Secundilactobacillus sp. TaxID=2813935 RepID=UPI002588483D|nr:YisL family protein [uncultured Secundilactobacillus sp.]
MWLLIHLVSFILLVPITIIGLTRKEEKRIAQWLILDRFLYLLILISGVILVIRTFQYSPVLISVKALLGLAVIALIEIAFGRKQERSLASGLVWTLAIVLVLTAGFGLWLGWGH